MKSIKVGFLTLVAALVTIGCAILQAYGVPVPNEAYGVTGGIALIGVRDRKIKATSEVKEWYESKTVWLAIIIVIISGLELYGFDMPEYLIAILSAAGAMFFDTAKTNIK